MENLQDLEDDLRDYSGHLQDLEFQRDVWSRPKANVLAEISQTRNAIEEIKSRISEALKREECDESLKVQNEIVARYAEMHRMKPDDAAYWFSKSYAATFRSLWNQNVRTIPELEYLMYQKGG